MKRLVFVMMLAALAAPAAAGPVLITSPAGLMANGTISWGVLGTTWTPIPQPFGTLVPGVPGLSVTVSETASANFMRVDEGNGWNGGDFAHGELLLWTYNSNGPMTFVFSGDVWGFGTQIQANKYGAFTATLEAFDAAQVRLASFTLPGDSGAYEDDRAMFIGILSDAPNVRSVRLGVISLADPSYNQDFAISDVLVQAVPEPASLLLLSTGLIGAVRAARRKRG